jgi:hypothetical protein
LQNATSLRSVQPIVHINTFGAFLRYLREREQLPLYAALVGNDFKLSPQERGTYVRLARLKIEGLQRRRPKLRPASEWRLLEIQLAQFDQDAKSVQEIGYEEQIKISGVRARQKISLDTGHIVGREEWRTKMLSHLKSTKNIGPSSTHSPLPLTSPQTTTWTLF